jgi:hypothetical protein
MELAEVLIVEARQYYRNDLKLIVPSLFGYTDQARLIKKLVTVTSAASRKKWDQISFLSDARAKIGENATDVLESLLHECGSLGAELSWGTGATKGSFTVRFLTLCQPSLFTIYSDGDLVVNFGGLNDKRGAVVVGAMLAEKLTQIGFDVPVERANKYPTYELSKWVSKGALVVSTLKEILQQTRAKDA